MKTTSLKRLLFFTLCFCSTVNIFAQLDPCGDGNETVNTAYSKLVFQSSTNGNNAAERAIDSISNQGALLSTTLQEDSPYWEIDLGKKMKITGFRVFYPESDSLKDYYIFISDSPFQSTNVATTLTQENLNYIHIASVFPSGHDLQDDFFGQYIRIQLNGTGVLSLLEVEIPGENIEDCGNGIDDDCDGLIDCDDSNCSASIYNVAINSIPTCPICSDGEIEIQVFGPESDVTYEDLRISIDGGQHYSPISSYTEIFSDLDEGDYFISVLNIITGCETQWSNNPLELRAPVGNPVGDCFNGGFEEGTFDGWQGNHGTLADGLTDEGIVNGRHTIVSAGEDPNAPIYLPLQGTYSCRLGNSNVFSEQESLTYCFVVDQDNADFSFNYAVVLQDPGHLPTQQAFFSYTIFRIINNIPEVLPGGFFKVVADLNNPFFESNGTIAYKGWTCEVFDLSDYIGEEVCIEFRTADCTESQHFGYAYIDGLCTNPEENIPTIELDIKEVYCLGQSIIADGGNSNGFNQYEWEVCQLDENGLENVCVSENFIGLNINPLDIVAFFEAPGNLFLCDKEYLIRLTLFNDCGDPLLIEEKFSYSCVESEISYEDILLCGGTNEPNIDVQFQGENDCNNCTFSWNPSYTLNNGTLEFPTLLGTLNVNAFKEDYIVTAINEVGCIYEEEVLIESLPPIEFIVIEDADYCFYELHAQVSYITAVNNTQVNVEFKNLTTGDTNQGVLISPPGNSTIFTYKLPDIVDKEDPDSYSVTVTWNVTLEDYYVIELGDNCSRTDIFHPTPVSLYFGDIEFQMPNAFTPDNDGTNDVFRPTLPLPWPENIHNAYWGKMQIFNRWGQLLFEDEVFGPKDGPPFGFSSLEWDGTQNGVLVPKDVYVWKVDFQNCSNPLGIQNDGCDCTIQEIADNTCDCEWAGEVTVIY